MPEEGQSKSVLAVVVDSKKEDKKKDKKQEKRKKAQSGQLVLEYVLLMMLAVAMAGLMKSQLIGGAAGQSCDEAPVLSGLVCRLTMAIAADTPGE